MLSRYGRAYGDAEMCECDAEPSGCEQNKDELKDKAQKSNNLAKLYTLEYRA